jgi:hypothetical protein
MHMRLCCGGMVGDSKVRLATNICCGCCCAPMLLLAGVVMLGPTAEVRPWAQQLQLHSIAYLIACHLEFCPHLELATTATAPLLWS